MNSRLYRDRAYIRGANSASGHDADAFAGMLPQSRKGVGTLYGIGFASSGQDPVGSAGNHILQGAIQIRT